MRLRDIRDYRLNVRFIAFWFVLAVAVGGGSYALHRFQLNRLGATYLDQANAARDRGEPAKELDYLRRYLTVEPGSAEARLRSARVQAALATRPRDRVTAFQTYQAALRADPKLPAGVRAEAVRVALHPSVRLHEEAKLYVEDLLKAEPANAEYLMLMADCYLYARDYRKAAEYLAATAKSDPRNVLAFARLAAIQRFELGRLEEGDATVDALAEQNPASAAAHVAAAEYWRRAGKKDPYAAAVEKARGLDPNDPDVVLTAADYLLTQAEGPDAGGTPDRRKAAIDSAVKLYEAALAAVAPQLPAADGPPPEAGSPGEKRLALAARAYHSLVAVLMQEGRPAEAAEWARKQAAALPNSPIAQLDLADAEIARGNLDEAEEVVAKLTRAKLPRPTLDFLAGRIATLRGQWADAARLLASAAGGLADNPELARRASLLLAACYRKTGELDRRYEAYRRAVPPEPLDPTWAPAVLGTAEALVELGRPAEAIAEYSRLAAVAPGANVPLARLLLQQALRQAEAARDFGAAERALASAPPGVERELVRAELTAARSGAVAARPQLDKAVEADPDSVRLRVARALLEANAKNAARAAELLDEARARLGDRIDFRVARVRVALARPPEEAAAELVKMAADAKTLKPEDRSTLLRSLAAAAAEIDRRDLARGWLGELAAERPDDVTLMTARFDLALQDGDEPAVAAVLADVDRVGGTGSVTGRVLHAFFLLWKGDRDKDAAAVAEAGRLLAGLEAQRPGWSRLYVAQARAALLSGDPLTAARRYRQAVDLGETSPEVYRRLLELYYQNEQYAEAAELMDRAPNAMLAGTGPELLAELSLSSKNYRRALEVARKAVKADSDDPKKLLWLARVTVLSGDLAAAEAPLRRAVEVDPKRPEAWVSLAQLLAALKKPAEAKAAAEACRLRLDPADAPLALAQCAEALGQAGDAEKFYAEALAARPADPAVLRAAAAYRVRRGDADGARKLLEQLLAAGGKSKDDEQFARRLLSLILASSADYATTRKALAVLGVPSADAAAQVTAGEPVDELRARVQVLARLRGRPSRESALRLLEAIEARTPLTADDLRTRATLYESLGEWGKARLNYAASLSAAGSPPQLVTDYVARLLQHGDTREARNALDAFRKRQPQAEAVAALEVQVAAAEGKRAAAAEAAAKIDRPEVAAVALERAGLTAEAEARYREFADAAKTEAARVALTRYLGRAGKFPAAWAELDKLWPTLTPETALSLACEMLLSNAATASKADVAGLVARVEQAAAANPAFSGHLAITRSLAGDQAAALALNRKALAANPDDVLALNNQAFLVAAVEKDYPAALELVRRAQQAAGPVPALLDSEGVILMLAGEPQKAADKFAESLVESAAAVTSFHLAHAYLALGRLPEARAALADARRQNFRLGDFHPLELPTVTRVLKELETP